jgi:hypothetical protein
MFAQGAPVAGAQDRFPEMEDLMVNSDQFLMFMNTNKLMNVAMMGAPKSTGMVMVIKAETAEIERLKKSNRLDAGKSVGGHSIHRVKNNRPGVKGTGPELLAFTDKLVLLTDLDEAQFVTVLDRGKKSPAKSDAIDLSRSVNRSPMWLAFTFDGETRKKLREAIEMGAQKVPAMQAAGPAFDGAKGVTLTTDVVGVNDLKLTASVMCKNAADAGKVKTGLEEGWKMVKGAIDGLMMFGGAPKGPEAKAMELLMRDLGKMSFSTSGDIASATLTFGNDTIDELAKGVKNNPFGPFGGMGPQPRPRFDGGPIVAPKGPTIFSAPNFIAGQLKDRQFQFEKGTRLRLDVHCGSQTGAVVEVAILEGAAGNKVVFTNNQKGAVRQVNFTVPATGTYRVRMRNLGPGVVPNATVFVFENP